MSSDEYPDILELKSGEKNPSAASEWHSDATWSPRPPMGSILICREAPPVGGDTNFCDAYGLWEGLHPSIKDQVVGLSAVHIGQPHHAMDGKLPKRFIQLHERIPKPAKRLYLSIVCSLSVSRKPITDEETTKTCYKNFSNRLADRRSLADSNGPLVRSPCGTIGPFNTARRGFRPTDESWNA